MNKVAKNATWIIVCKSIQALLTLVINMLTARYLGPSSFGVITYASSIVAFVVPLMQLGFGGILVQEIVNNPEREGAAVGTTIGLSVISSLFCILGVTSFALVANYDDPATIWVCFLYSFILIFQALDLIQYWFQAKYLSKYTSIVSLCAYIVVSAYKAFLLITHKSVYWFAISNAFDYALIAISSIIIYRKLHGQGFSFSWALGKQLFSRSKHYIISAMMVTIFAQTDKIMIEIMIDKESTGFYGAAVACAGMTSFVFAAIIDSFRPSILEGIKKSETVFRSRLISLYSIVIYLSLLQSLFMTFLAGLVIHVLYGGDYIPAVSALRIIVWYTTFSYLGAVRNIWILAKEKQRYLWIINLMGASANVILNLVLIPLMGINGAALASLVTQIYTNVIVGFIIRPIRPNNSIMIKSLNPKYLFELLKSVRPNRKRKASKIE